MARPGRPGRRGGYERWGEYRRPVARTQEAQLGDNGTDTRIERDGSYTVTAIYMRTAREVRKGIISRAEIHELVRQIDDAQLFAMKDKSSAPFKSEWSWWGYILTVKTERGSKTIRFHSEDDTVPEGLKRIVESIMGMTK